MDIDTVIYLIQNLGFPICVCLILLFQYKKAIDKLSDSINNFAESIKDPKKEITEISDNVKMIKENVQEMKTELLILKKNQDNICKVS